MVERKKFDSFEFEYLSDFDAVCLEIVLGFQSAEQVALYSTPTATQQSLFLLFSLLTV
jgi:hypothetical protein